MKTRIYEHTACPWREQLCWYDTTDSTNTQAKRLARQGAPHGTVLIAEQQTGGRGRMGRQFVSDPGLGIYLSVLLRPNFPPEQLMHLTCATAVAMCDAVEAVAGFRPGVKWINDLVYEGRKLGGILTELSVEAGMTEYAVIGIGINCCQQKEDLPAQLQDMAGSLAMVTGRPIDRTVLAGAMIDALWQMDQQLANKEPLMTRYRQDCITLGRDIAIHGADEILHGKALDIDPDGGLVVQLENGSIRTVCSGEVSVRGLYGYI